MILFYSEECQHCSILIDTIKKHDTKKNIKLISINNLKNNPILNKISYVPALMFLPSKEIIYGKSVFDYLLLPNRGFLFNNTNTRTEKNISNSSIVSPVPLNNEIDDKEPLAFSLGSIVSDRFSDISDNDNNSMVFNNDKVYKWSSIDHIDKSIDINKNENLSDKKNLPSLDEINRERELLLK
jgi:hypothetical protein